MVEKWLEREIARGLQGLIALRLSGAPADDSVTLTLDVWLAAPAKFVPGTSMTFRGLSDPLDRADVIAYLQTQAVEAEGVEVPTSRP